MFERELSTIYTGENATPGRRGEDTIHFKLTILTILLANDGI